MTEVQKRLNDLLQKAFEKPITMTKAGEYNFGGRPCHHSSLTEWKDVIWASRTEEQEHDEFDLSCCLLASQSMCIYKPLSLVLCVRCRVLLDLEGLKKHIGVSTHFHKLTPQRARHKRARFLEHVKIAFDVPTDFHPVGIAGRTVLHRPIPFLPDPSIFIHCPNPECDKPFKYSEDNKSSGKVYGHLRESESCAASERFKELSKAGNWRNKWQTGSISKMKLDKSQLPPFVEATQAYAQLYSPGSAGVRQFVLYCPEGWAPKTIVEPVKEDAECEGNPPHTLDMIVDQAYANELGWDKLFQTESGKKVNIDPWTMLLRPIEDGKDEIEEGTDPDHTEALERGLAVVRAFLFNYLDAANTSVRSFVKIFARLLVSTVP